MDVDLTSGQLAAVLQHLTPLLSVALTHRADPLQVVLGAGGVTNIWDALNKIKGFFDTLFTHFLPIGLAACACWYGWGGLQHIFSGGSPDQVRKAKATWWHATIGVAGVILATPLVNTIHAMFG